MKRAAVVLHRYTCSHYKNIYTHARAGRDRQVLVVSLLSPRQSALSCVFERNFSRVFRYVFFSKSASLFSRRLSLRVYTIMSVFLIASSSASASAFRSEKSGVIRSRSSAFASSSSSAKFCFLRSLPSSSLFRCRRRETSVSVRGDSSFDENEESGSDELQQEEEQQPREFDTLKELEKDVLAFQAQDLSNPEKQKQREKDMQKKQGVDAFKEGVDQFLLYDFFVILFILAWLVFGVGVRLGVYKQGLSYDEPVLGTWLFLWPFLFQPLLGVHMLATLVSPLIGKLKEKGILGEDTWQ